MQGCGAVLMTLALKLPRPGDRPPTEGPLSPWRANPNLTLTPWRVCVSTCGSQCVSQCVGVHAGACEGEHTCKNEREHAHVSMSVCTCVSEQLSESVCAFEGMCGRGMYEHVQVGVCE